MFFRTMEVQNSENPARPGPGARVDTSQTTRAGAPPFSFITRVAPHCVNTLRILHAAHED